MGPNNSSICINRPKVLLAAKTCGSVFYDKLTRSIARCPSTTGLLTWQPPEGTWPVWYSTHC